MSITAKDVFHRLRESPVSVLRYLLDRRMVTAKCGHRTRLVGTIEGYGKRYPFSRLPPEPMLCFDCLNKETIPCAWCGKPIFPGDPVTLYTPNDPEYEPPEGSKVYTFEPLRLVGCLRWDCAEGGMDRAGFWHPPEGVHRVLSPIEECLATGDVVVVNDLRDPSQAIPLPQE